MASTSMAKILADKNLTSKAEYSELCSKDNRLPKNPEDHFGSKFINWVHYLGISGDYYDLETCKSKVQEYLKENPALKRDYYLKPLNICYELCSLDDKFPPREFWVDYYNVKNLAKIIAVNIKIKKIVQLIKS